MHSNYYNEWNAQDKRRVCVRVKEGVSMKTDSTWEYEYYLNNITRNHDKYSFVAISHKRRRSIGSFCYCS